MRTPADGSVALVLGKDRRGRVTTDTARAAAVFVFVVRRSSLLFVVCRLSFVVCRSSHFGLWALGFFFIFGLWLASAGVSQLILHMLRPSCDGTDSVQRRFKGPGYLLVGRRRRPAGRRIAHGPQSVLVPWGFVVVLCVESRVTSPQPQPQSQSDHPTRANLVHMYEYDPQDMKKKGTSNVGERSAGADSVVMRVFKKSGALSRSSVVRRPASESSESSNDVLAPEDFKKVQGRSQHHDILFLIPLMFLYGDPVCVRCRQWVTVTMRRRRG